jgi:hypothetical protein
LTVLPTVDNRPRYGTVYIGFNALWGQGRRINDENVSETAVGVRAEPGASTSHVANARAVMAVELTLGK